MAPCAPPSLVHHHDIQADIIEGLLYAYHMYHIHVAYFRVLQITGRW